MDAANQTAAAAGFMTWAVDEIEAMVPGITATKYLSVAGLVILLYDHLLLFGDETQLIWQAKWSWSKALFLVSRYTVPLCIIVTAYQLSGISPLTNEFCRTWISMVTFLNTLSLCIATIFVVQRVYALWGRSKRLLCFLVPMITGVYITSLTLGVVAVLRLRPRISFFPLLKTCMVEEKPILLVPVFAVPLCFDVFLFIITCWNALDRPRHMHTALVSQLYVDGAVFFLAILTLRLFNIVVIAAAPLAYLQLGVYFLWAMITAVINRMLITISASLESSQNPELIQFLSLARDSEESENWKGHDDFVMGPFTKSHPW